MIRKIEPYLWFAARIFVGLVFSYAGITKLLEPAENLRGAVAQYGVIPYALVPAVAYTMPWIEFIFGVFLILGYAPRFSAAVLCALSLGFLIVLGSSTKAFDGLLHDCGCFGEGSIIHLNPLQVFFLDLFDFFVTLQLSRLREHVFSLDGLLRRKSSV